MAVALSHKSVLSEYYCVLADPQDRCDPYLASLQQSGAPAVSEDEMQLTKSTDRKISGVCGGIAEWLGCQHPA